MQFAADNYVFYLWIIIRNKWVYSIVVIYCSWVFRGLLQTVLVSRSRFWGGVVLGWGGWSHAVLFIVFVIITVVKCDLLPFLLMLQVLQVLMQSSLVLLLLCGLGVYSFAWLLWLGVKGHCLCLDNTYRVIFAVLHNFW